MYSRMTFIKNGARYIRTIPVEIDKIFTTSSLQSLKKKNTSRHSEFERADVLNVIPSLEAPPPPALPKKAGRTDLLQREWLLVHY